MLNVKQLTQGLAYVKKSVLGVEERQGWMN